MAIPQESWLVRMSRSATVPLSMLRRHSLAVRRGLQGGSPEDAASAAPAVASGIWRRSMPVEDRPLLAVGGPGGARRVPPGAIVGTGDRSSGRTKPTNTLKPSTAEVPTSKKTTRQGQTKQPRCQPQRRRPARVNQNPIARFLRALCTGEAAAIKRRRLTDSHYGNQRRILR